MAIETSRDGLSRDGSILGIPCHAERFLSTLEAVEYTEPSDGLRERVVISVAVCWRGCGMWGVALADFAWALLS